MKPIRHWPYLLLFFAAFLQFSNTLSHSYVFDDKVVIVNNKTIQKGFKAIPDLFQNKFIGEATTNRIYRPITFSTFAIEYAFFGLNPFISHLTNVILFALTCLLIYFFLTLLFYKHNKIFPLLICLLFIVHPIHCEVVANIKSRDEILSTLFSILCLISLLTAYKNKKPILVLASLLFFLFALFSKLNSAVLLGLAPLILLFYLISNSDISEIGFKNIIKTIVYSSPFLLVFIAFGLIRKSASKSLTNIDSGSTVSLLSNSLFDAPIWEFYGTICLITISYFKQLFIPYPLVYYSGFNQIPLVSILQIEGLISFAFLMAIIGIAIYLLLKKRSPIGMGICFFFISLSVYLHFGKLGFDTMANRFLYLPSIGFSIALIYSLASIFRLNSAQNPLNQKRGKAFLIVNLVWIFTLSILTFSRNKAWANNLSLFSTDIPHLSNCARANTHYANTLIETCKANPTTEANLKAKWKADIFKHFKKAIEIYPENANAYLMIAKAHMYYKDFDQALNTCKDGLLNLPDNGQLPFCVAETYYMQEDYAEAIPFLQKCINRNTTKPRSYYYLIWSYYKTDQIQQSIETCTRAISEFPKDALFPRELGKLYYFQNNKEAAKIFLEKSYLLFPFDTEVLHTLAKLYAEEGNLEKGREFADKYKQLKSARAAANN